ncbi:hypothetical protein DL771_006057 [Monosporascus sp. 5C6A]|nr:hypothetical protein DL771_006057 [Monosporascus sp. 5C6A]
MLAKRQLPSLPKHELNAVIRPGQATHITMSLKAALIALFAASAIATPTQLTRRAGGKYLDDQEEYERAKTRVPNLGWCTFHIHEEECLAF